MTFTWTNELAALTPPFRGDGKPIKAKKVDAKLLEPVATSLAPHVAKSYKPRKSLVELATTGKGSFADEADAAIILAGTGLSGPFKGELTMVSEKDTKKVVNAVVDRWVEVHGMADTVEICTLVGAWKPYDLFTTGFSVRFARARVREWLAHHPHYDAALERAKKLSGAKDFMPHEATHDGHARGIEVMSYLFPDHRPFFQAGVDALKKTKDTKSSYLVASVSSVDDMNRLVPMVGISDLGRHGLVIPRSLKEQGLPVLVEATKGDSPPEGESFALALSAYASADAAAAVARLLVWRSLHKLVTGYFAANKSLAKEALGPLQKSDEKKIREAATKILAAI